MASSTRRVPLPPDLPYGFEDDAHTIPVIFPGDQYLDYTWWRHQKDLIIDQQQRASGVLSPEYQAQFKDFVRAPNDLNLKIPPEYLHNIDGKLSNDWRSIPDAPPLGPPERYRLKGISIPLAT